MRNVTRWYPLIGLIVGILGLGGYGELLRLLSGLPL